MEYASIAIRKIQCRSYPKKQSRKTSLRELLIPIASPSGLKIDLREIKRKYFMKIFWCNAGICHARDSAR
jgi:hypothetical protein